MKHKTATGALRVKSAGEGLLSAVICTFNVRDLDGDVVLPDAIKDGSPVRLSAYNHASWGPGALPIGRGTISTTATQAVFDGQVFMNTQAGADTFETIKGLGDLAEYSWGYDIAEDGAQPGEFKGERVRFLKSLIVHEVSPVLLGASIGTRTVSAKRRTTGRASAAATEQLCNEMRSIELRALLRDTEWDRLSRMIPD